MTTIDQIDAFDPHERIKPNLKKESDEYYVLATLRYYNHERFKDWRHDDAPDLQKSDYSDGIEVTTIEEGESDFQFQCIRNEMKKDNKSEKKISKAKEIIHKNGKEINCISINGNKIYGLMEGGTSNSVITAISKAIERKREKITNYKNKCQKIGLAIIVESITITDADLEPALNFPNSVPDKPQFDAIYILTNSELIIFDNQEKKKIRVGIPKCVRLRIKKISRMTAEKRILLSDPIWNSIHHLGVTESSGDCSV